MSVNSPSFNGATVRILDDWVVYEANETSKIAFPDGPGRVDKTKGQVNGHLGHYHFVE